MSLIDLFDMVLISFAATFVLGVVIWCINDYFERRRK